jgi:hypothetical protein
MKLHCACLLLCASALGVYGQAQQIIKQRAKDLRDQNNAAQGVPAAPANSPTIPASTAAPVISAPTPQQQSFARVRATVEQARAGTALTTQQREKLASDLVGMAAGPGKPARANADKLAEALSEALASKPIAASQRTRLLDRIKAVLVIEPGHATDIDAAAFDVLRLLQSSGVDATTAGRVSEALKALGTDMRKVGSS